MLSSQALRRRIKRKLNNQDQTFFASCAPGFEQVLSQELKTLAVELGEQEHGGVSFTGPLESCYLANVQLASAHRVLWRIDYFLAQSYPMLFDHARKVPWEIYLGFLPSYRLKVSAKTSRLRQHKNIAKTLDSAIAARLNPLGLTPKPQKDAVLEIFVRLYQDHCTLSLNTTGPHLHKRGYRSLQGQAPMRETLAASLLLSHDLASHDLILDPMCGSGTLLIEACLLSQNRAPGLARSFAFEHFPSFKPGPLKRLKDAAKAQETPVQTRFIGHDLNPKTLALAQENAAAAGLTEPLSFSQQDALHLSAPPAKNPLLVCNLPYGERLGDQRKASHLARDFAQHLKANFDQWNVILITKTPKPIEEAGLKLEVKTPFKNGGLQVYALAGQV